MPRPARRTVASRRWPAGGSRAILMSGAVFNRPVIILVQRGESFGTCRANARTPTAFCFAPRGDTQQSRALAHPRLRARTRVSLSKFSSCASTPAALEPSFFVSDGDRSELDNRILRVIRRLSNRLRSVPSAWCLLDNLGPFGFRDDPISAGGRTDPLPVGSCLFDERPHRQRRRVRQVRELNAPSIFAALVLVLVLSVRIERTRRCSRPKPASRLFGARKDRS